MGTHVQQHAAVLVGVIFGTLTAIVDAQTCGFDGYDFSEEFHDKTLEAYDSVSFWTAEITPCGKSSSGFYCQLPDNFVDMVNKMSGDYCSGVIARWDDSGVWSYVNGNNNQDGIQVDYANGDSCGLDSQPQELTMIFKCEDDTELSAQAKDGISACKWEVTVPSELACRSSGGGLSGGWIFVIIVLVTFAVYLIVGFAYKTKQKGTSGTESIPNIEFWRGLPSLVKEGCQYTMEKVRGNKGTYQDVGETEF